MSLSRSLLRAKPGNTLSPVTLYHQRTSYSILANLTNNMATSKHIEVTASNSGLLNLKQTDTSASKVSELLQKDLERHHVFFNTSGFHNHISHQLLTLYGTGASADTLQKAYDHNASYQIKANTPRDNVVEELNKDWAANAPNYLGKGKHYADFLGYFQAQIEKHGWQDVVKEYVFKGDARTPDLFSRQFAGFLHPLIQLMYGIEWEQPAMVAEALAQASVHEDRLGDFLTKAEEAAKNKGSPSHSIPKLFEAVGKTGKLAKSAHWDDPNRVYDGVMVRAPDEAIEFLAQVSVKPEELEERTAEMVHTAAYVAATAAIHPPHVPMFDFFIIHHLNSAPIFLSINKHSWLSPEMKVRLLEWKIRMDIVQYVARGCPSLQLDAVKAYKPADSASISKPQDLLPRFHSIPDDGHLIKVARSLLIAQDVSRKYEGRPWIRFADDGTWLNTHHMLLDGSQAGGATWVRSAGFDNAWENVPKATLA